MPVSLRLPEDVKKRVGELLEAPGRDAPRVHARRDPREAGGRGSAGGVPRRSEAPTGADEEDRCRHSRRGSVRVPAAARCGRPRQATEAWRGSRDRLRRRGAGRPRADLRVQLRARPDDRARSYRPDPKCRPHTERAPGDRSPGPATSPLRELIISHGKTGYIALYEYSSGERLVRILAVRHQREAGYQGR